MHELPITEDILRIALDASGGRQVSAIDVVIGELSSVVDDSVQFYFDILSEGTAAENASLHFRRLPATATCRDCGTSFAVTPPLPVACPQCTSVRIQVTGGRELRVDSIEVED